MSSGFPVFFVVYGFPVALFFLVSSGFFFKDEHSRRITQDENIFHTRAIAHVSIVFLRATPRWILMYRMNLPPPQLSTHHPLSMTVASSPAPTTPQVDAGVSTM